MATGHKLSQPSEELVPGRKNDEQKKAQWRHFLKTRHKVHCSDHKTDDGFEEDRGLYQEVVVAEPNPPPFFPFARTVRHCFKLEEPVFPDPIIKQRNKKVQTTHPKMKSKSVQCEPDVKDQTTQDKTESANKKIQIGPDIKNKTTQQSPASEEKNIQIVPDNQDASTQSNPDTKDVDTLAPDIPDKATDEENKKKILEEPKIETQEMEIQTDPEINNTTQQTEPPSPATKEENEIQKKPHVAECIHVVREELLVEMKIEILKRLEIFENGIVNKKEKDKDVQACLCHQGEESYIGGKHPHCGKCCLVEHGHNLLVVSQSWTAEHILPPLCLGQLLLCLETDNDSTFKDILEFLHSDANDDAAVVVYQRLIVLACVWQAYKCLRLLLDQLGFDNKNIDSLIPPQNDGDGEETDGGSNLPGNSNGTNNSPAKAPRGPVSHNYFLDISKILKELHYLKDPGKKHDYYDDLFKAARARTEDGVTCFEALLKNSDKANVFEKQMRDNRIILHELIDLDMDCTRMEDPSEGRKQRALVKKMLMDIYAPTYIDCWKKPMGKVTDIEALSSLFSKTNSEIVNPKNKILNCTKQFFEKRYTWTPIQYAANKGTPDMIKEIIEHPPYKVTIEGQECYWVDEIDSVLTGRQGNKASVLDLLQRRKINAEGASILNLQPFKSLVEDKWSRYRGVYITWVVACLLHIVLYTICALTRPVGKSTIAELYTTPWDYARLFVEILVIIGICILVYSEIRDIVNGRYYLPLPWQRLGLYRITNLLFIILTVIVIILRIASPENEDTVLALALVCGWMNMIHRLSAFRPMGMFPIIMHHAIFKDLLPGFIWVYLTCLCALSTATFVAYRSAAENQDDFPKNNYFRAPHSLFKLTFGLLDTGYELQSYFQPLGVILFYLFLIYSNIVLLNVLVAMVSTTYAKMFDVVENHWIKIQLGYILLMESWFPFHKFKRWNIYEKANNKSDKRKIRYFKSESKNYITVQDSDSNYYDVDGNVYIL